MPELLECGGHGWAAAAVGRTVMTQTNAAIRVRLASLHRRLGRLMAVIIAGSQTIILSTMQSSDGARD